MVRKPCAFSLFRLVVEGEVFSFFLLPSFEQVEPLQSLPSITITIMNTAIYKVCSVSYIPVCHFFFFFFFFFFLLENTYSTRIV